MDPDKKFKEELEFWNRVAESDGFDVEHLMDKRPRFCSLTPLKFENNDCPTEIVLYAMMGIHKYNLIKGKKLQFSCVEKCNYRAKLVYSSYHITLVAKDPAAGDSLVTFQTKVFEEEGCGIKSLTCSTARPKLGPQDTVEEPNQPLDDDPVENCYSVRMPEWPSENVFNDTNRFYVVKKSELRKYDWIRLYMELAFLNANTNLNNPDLSKLVIIKVAVETNEDVEQPNERLKARSAIFYIKYKYYPNNKGLACKVHGNKPPRDRIAIIKRTMDRSRRFFNLMFHSRYAKTLL